MQTPSGWSSSFPGDPTVLHPSASIAKILSETARRLDANDAPGAVDWLATQLAAVRQSATGTEWRDAAKAIQAHALHSRLLEDPYLWAAFHKPRGYAGDAHTLDFVY